MTSIDRIYPLRYSHPASTMGLISMLIGVISDSHDHLTHLEYALERCLREGIAGLIHPGDVIAPFAARIVAERWKGPRFSVYGNNDGERKGLKLILPEIVDGPILVEWGGRRISVDHYPPDNEHRPIDDCELVIFGHTHIASIERKNGTVWLNPGETCGWVTGRATFALVDSASMRIEIVEIEK